MGFMTTVLILNDHFGSIQDDPARFVERISEDMHDGTRRSNGVQVFRTGHADAQRLYLTHRNAGYDLSYASPSFLDLATSPEPFRRELADDVLASARQLVDDMERIVAERRKAGEGDK